MDIRRVDPADAETLRAWWQVGAVAARHDHADDSWPSWEVTLARLAVPEPDRDDHRLVVVSAAGEPLGQARATMFTTDNPHLVFADLSVVPSARSQGAGSALLGALEELVRAEGRTTIVCEVVVPATYAGGTTRDLAFAARHGYAVVQQEAVKAVDLAATEDRLAGLEAHAAERLGDHRLVSWTGATPEEHVDAVAALYSRFLGEIPLGGMDLEPQHWDAAKVREVEARFAATGRRRHTVAAVAPDGTLAGYSDFDVQDGRPERGEIDGTLVLPEHRGHRLGLALKVRLHQEARSAFPALTRIVTANADENGSMNRVNDQLGYVVLERIVETQKVLAQRS